MRVFYSGTCKTSTIEGLQHGEKVRICEIERAGGSVLWKIFKHDYSGPAPIFITRRKLELESKFTIGEKVNDKRNKKYL